jgi:hypothetical protein
MPLILARPRNGRMDVLIVLGPDNIERIQEKDPVEVQWDDLPFSGWLPRTIGITYATQAEMTQMEQLCRQGKRDEAIKMAVSGWKFRPERGDHDGGFQAL